MGAAALAVDEQSLPANHYAALSQQILQRPAYRGFVTALNAYLLSANGGSYASFRAYLADKSAKLHPLFGELCRAVLGEQCFTSGSVVAGVSNPAYAAVFPTKVFTGADGALVDDLTDATDVGTADVALFDNDDECLYVGYDRKFSAVVVALSTAANTSITPVFSYFNGSSWATLTCTDNSAGLTKNEAITFTAPSDWTRAQKGADGTAFPGALERLYYIRIARTANTVGTPPVGTCISIVPEPVYTAPGGSLHLGVEQPPLALVRVTGTNTIVVTAPAAVDHTRFAHPLTAESKLRLRALTPIGANVTFTCAYVSDAGANASAAQSAWSSIDALDTFTLSLSGSDGLRSVRTSSTATTTATEGVFCLEALPIRTPAV